jgi:hypothetical protein
MPVTAVAAGGSHTCAITKEAAELHCWGYDYLKQVTGMTGTKGTCGSYYCAGLANTTKFTAVAAGSYHTCAITKEAAELHCWGDDLYKQDTGMTGTKGTCGKFYCAGLAASTKFTAVAAGDTHTCAVTKEPAGVVCWGLNNAQQATVPPAKDVKFLEEPSCGTSHSELSGPASCTSCDPKGCNKHFTIMDPKAPASPA